MNTNRIFRIREDGIAGTIQAFLTSLWKIAQIDAMLVPVKLPDDSGVEAQVITSPVELAAFNPYAGEMLSNSASMIAEFLQGHKNQKLAAVLRPCELRALIELQKRGRVTWQAPQPGKLSDWLLIIGIDCAREARLACQICDSPIPHNTDITIGEIGLQETMQHLLIIARDEYIDKAFHLDFICNRIAFEEDVVVWEQATGAIINRNAAHRKELYKHENGTFDDLSSLLAFFSRCTLCTDCLDACPLYDGELAGMLGVPGMRQRESPLLPELVRVSRWLASCSGCGMCQQACSNGAALMPLVAGLSHRIREKLHYAPGEQAQTLPWRPTSQHQEEEQHVIP